MCLAFVPKTRAICFQSSYITLHMCLAQENLLLTSLLDDVNVFTES